MRGSSFAGADFGEEIVGPLVGLLLADTLGVDSESSGSRRGFLRGNEETESEQ